MGAAAAYSCSMPTRTPKILLGILLAIVFAGCSYDQANGPGIAEHLRGLQSPIVAEVRYVAGDVLHAATVEITLTDGVAETDASTFICHEALPFAAASNPPDRLAIKALDRKGSVVATDVACR